VHDFVASKARGEKIVVITAYDYTMARLVDEAGIHAILVGDSLGNVMLGYDSTLPVTMEDMIHHIKAVVRGSRKSLVIGDMPFMSYQVSTEQAVASAGRLLQEAGCQAVKLEGGRSVAASVAKIVASGIPVMGHLGLTPQSIHQLGGYKVQGKSDAAAEALIQDALALEEAGAFSIVLEYVPIELARTVSEKLTIPTIGIGAGPHCDGQVQVIADMLALNPEFNPKHAKVYAPIGEAIKEAVSRYAREVVEGEFPSDRQSFGLRPKEAMVS
jgi:3-methyl-2-oxobutanoate hydroxymethyltransferase